MSRRALIAAGAALACPGVLRAQVYNNDLADAIRSGAVERTGENVQRNASSFRAQDWRDHFDKLGVVTLVADTKSRALHYWSADGSDYRLYPTSVPKTEELTKRGYTKVVRKKVGPDWTPTPSMVAADPSLHYMPPGPGNPLGTHAMYLDWPAYLIHGTHDTRKIGRQSSSGCIGLYNEQIVELFELTPVGAQVRII